MSSIPYYLLDQIFTHLPYESLVTCRAVSPLWNATILSRQVLRRKLFLQPPTPGIDEKIFRRRPISLHPVLRRLESDWAILNVPITITTAPSTERSPGDQPIAKPKLLHDSAVKDVFATEPALPEFVLMLPTHSLVVQRAGGVTVEDVANGVKKMYEDMAKTMGGNFVESCPSMLNGFRQTNRLRGGCLNVKFIATFRYEKSVEGRGEVNGILVAG